MGVYTAAITATATAAATTAAQGMYPMYDSDLAPALLCLQDPSLPAQLQGAQRLGQGGFGEVYAIPTLLADGSDACIKVT
jgi:hypothetical protein